MRTASFQPRVVALVAGLTLAALACGSFGAEPTATPFAKPTKAPSATATEEPVEPTQAPQPTKTPETQIAFTLADETYEHPSGAFAIRLPDGWDIEEFDSSVSANDPTGVGFIEVAFVNVGVEFTAEQLAAYAQAVEDNWFATFEDYESDGLETLESGTILVFKTLDFEGTPQTVYSFYWLEGTVVYEEDFWVDSDQYDVYIDGYGDVSGSTRTDPDAGAAAGLYALQYEFTAPDELFAFYVPYGWAYTTDTDDVATLDSFNSPDDVTSVESIVYDDGTEISQSLAGEFALTLLREFYDFGDVRVSTDEPLADGRERLTWSSAASGVDGISYFESRGTTFIMLTWIVEQDYTAFYVPLWNEIADSYYVP
jgi:hypothetical protein